MNAMSHEFDLGGQNLLARRPAPEADRIDAAALGAQWDAVHEAAGAVAILAQLGPEPLDEDMRELPARAAALDQNRLALVARGVDDLSAIMQPGLRALLALTDKGQDTTSAALTLWREFYTARAAILALVPAR